MKKAYDVDEIRKKYAKAYTSWTAEEDALLRNAYEEFRKLNISLHQSEEIFFADYGYRTGRKPGAIRSRIAKFFEGATPIYSEKKDKAKKKFQLPVSKPHVNVSVSSQQLDLNPEFQKAYELMEKTDKNVFITGRAGTGKSTLLTYFRNNTKKKVVVLAPTGVAAINVRGQTIHSFFKFRPDITIQRVKRHYKKNDSKNLYENIETIVIDEISMVRSDLLDCVDKFLRLNRSSNRPFGGVQMIFIGDLYQLPPVVAGSEREIFRTHYASQYFFDAKVFQELQLEFIELEKVYRQKDDIFISLLNAVRNNSATEEHLFQINTRFIEDFIADPKSFSIHLTTTNDLADRINDDQLGRLKSKLFTYTGLIDGSFDKNSLPTDIELQLKVGAQVMMLNNDSQRRWVNGTIGKIIAIEKDEDDEDRIIVDLADGNIEEVTPFTWELFHFAFDQKANSLTSETVGTFTQYPMRLAWAVTIHKSQGKTFEKVIIDIGRGTFVHGQLYVALSRCTTLTGIVLKQPVQKKHIFMDWRVVKFVTGFQYQKSQTLMPLDEKIRLLQKAADTHQSISIVYLKANDEKSRRVIHPIRVGEMKYLEKTFLGVDAFDEKSRESRVFRVDRILSME